MISNQKAVSSPAGDFVGRREELDYFRHALVETTGKKLRGFLLSGEPGIGKTRLAEECALTAEQKQMPAAERRRLCVKLVREVERRFEGNLESRALRLTGWWSQIGWKEAQERVRSYTVMAAETALRAGAWEEAVSMSGDRPGAVRYFKQAFEWYHRTGGLEKMFEIATQP